MPGTKKKIIPLNIDRISPQLMSPGQKAAQERLFQPQQFNNQAPDYHPDAYRKAGMPMPEGMNQQQQNFGDDGLSEDKSMDDFGQRAEMNENSDPTILSYDPNDIDKQD